MKLTLSRYQSSQTNVLTAMSSWVGAMVSKTNGLIEEMNSVNEGNGRIAEKAKKLQDIINSVGQPGDGLKHGGAAE